MTDNLTQKLIDGLAFIPNSWQIVPTNGNKQPLGYQWQLYPFNKDELIRSLQSTGSVKVRNCNGNQMYVYPKGIGVLTGKQLVAVDVDGNSAMTALQRLSKHRSLPCTVAFTSGKPGRCQYLFSIPNCTNAALKSRRIRTRVKDEALEIRYAGMMSVLPPSVHPQTGQYRWVRYCSPVECAIAIAPQWLTQLMHKGLPEKSTPKLQQTLQQSSGVKNDRIAALLAQINPWRADDYREWIRIGMALYSHSPTLLYLWDEWSRQSNKYKPGECERKWDTFNPNRITIGTLYYLAQIDSGYRSE